MIHAITKDYAQDDTPIWKQNATNDREVYRKIYYQLNQMYALPIRPIRNNIKRMLLSGSALH